MQGLINFEGMNADIFVAAVAAVVAVVIGIDAWVGDCEILRLG